MQFVALFALVAIAGVSAQGITADFPHECSEHCRAVRVQQMWCLNHSKKVGPYPGCVCGEESINEELAKCQACLIYKFPQADDTWVKQIQAMMNMCGTPVVEVEVNEEFGKYVTVGANNIRTVENTPTAKTAFKPMPTKITVTVTASASIIDIPVETVTETVIPPHTTLVKAAKRNGGPTSTSSFEGSIAPIFSPAAVKAFETDVLKQLSHIAKGVDSLVRWMGFGPSGNGVGPVLPRERDAAPAPVDGIVGDEAPEMEKRQVYNPAILPEAEHLVCPPGTELCF